MAQYAGICKEGDTNKGLTAAARDATTINALNIVSIGYVLLLLLYQSRGQTAGCAQSYPNVQNVWLRAHFTSCWQHSYIKQLQCKGLKAFKKHWLPEFFVGLHKNMHWH